MPDLFQLDALDSSALAQQQLCIPLVVQGCRAVPASHQPLTAGIPIARGLLWSGEDLVLQDPRGQAVACQSQIMARWTDGSAKWVLLDFLAAGLPQGESTWTLSTRRPAADERRREPAGQRMHLRWSSQEIIVGTGAAEFRIDGRTFCPIREARFVDQPSGSIASMETLLTDFKGRPRPARIERLHVETHGAVRTTLSFAGRFPGRRGLEFRSRLCFFAGSGLVRIRFTLHNPNRARHRGGLWDLGDPGSCLFGDLSLHLRTQTSESNAEWISESGQQSSRCDDGRLEIYQDSSGGENWQSRNHVNRQGRIPCRFRGYRVRTSHGEQFGLRASPVLALGGSDAAVVVAVPEFWQQFPKALASEPGSVRIGLFPEQWDDLFELQGGEQKTHTIWLNFCRPGHDALGGLLWAHSAATALPAAGWVARTQAIPHFVTSENVADGRLRNYLAEVVKGSTSLVARREVIDEYGWRNYGDVYADHEAAYYHGPQPVVSHYNNQFDMVYGSLLQWLRTADPAWHDVADPLARHLADIDIYHTRRDRPAYNGGLFWMTDHYLDAGTATHRTYTNKNRPHNGSAYGGGPGSEHNFTTGLLLYYYLTGDIEARRTLLELAEWVIAMDDGRSNVLGLIDPGATGLATWCGSLTYHGPGRGAGNSVNALLDGWLVCGEQRFLEKAESLIRRVIHPQDDVARHDLLEFETRWSYTVFLSSLARYLDLKAETGQLDDQYAYARSSLLHYARWMLDHERPYFDRPEQMEYPTEAWAAQEFRKANVLRLAACHAGDDLRARLLARGAELADRAWDDLLRFDSRRVARAVAVLMVEGVRDLYFRGEAPRRAPDAAGADEFGLPKEFVPQRMRVRAQLTTVGGLGRAFLRVLKPSSWRRVRLRF